MGDSLMAYEEQLKKAVGSMDEGQQEAYFKLLQDFVQFTQALKDREADTSPSDTDIIMQRIWDNEEDDFWDTV